MIGMVKKKKKEKAYVTDARCFIIRGWKANYNSELNER